MAKKHLSAETKQKISESVKRARVARLAASKTTTSANDAAIQWRGALPEPLGRGGNPTPRSSKDEAAQQLAADLVDLVGDEMPALALVRMVDRILRP